MSQESNLLFKLPPELRLQVYGFLLPPATQLTRPRPPVVTYRKFDKLKHNPLWVHPSLYIGLLGSCRQIRLELESLITTRANRILQWMEKESSDWSPHARIVTSDSLQNLRDLTILYRQGDYPPYDTVLQLFPLHLRRLTFRVYEHPNPSYIPLVLGEYNVGEIHKLRRFCSEIAFRRTEAAMDEIVFDWTKCPQDRYEDEYLIYDGTWHKGDENHDDNIQDIREFLREHKTGSDKRDNFYFELTAESDAEHRIFKAILTRKKKPVNPEGNQ